MINDVIYQQHYAKKVEAYAQQVAQNAFTQGRQQGWNDILFILNEYENKGVNPSTEMVVESLKQLLSGEFTPETEETVETVEQTPTQPAKKNHLSVIK